MSLATNRAFAEQGYIGDYCTEAKAHVPVTEAQALWESQTRAEDAAERDERIAAQVVAEKADKRARSVRDHARDIEEAANRLANLIAAARTDGFGVVGAEEMKDLARNAVWLLREQQEQVHG